MEVVHRTDGDRRTLATEVAVADGLIRKARGCMFRRSVPEDYALVFPFDSAAARTLHMLFVPFALDAVWLVDGEVTRVERLPPWVGVGRARADEVLELPAGAAEDVSAGDRVVVE